jgi:hypothetical protein
VNFQVIPKENPCGFCDEEDNVEILSLEKKKIGLLSRKVTTWGDDKGDELVTSPDFGPDSTSIIQSCLNHVLSNNKYL